MAPPDSHKTEVRDSPSKPDTTSKAAEPPKEDLQAWSRVLGAWLLFVAAWGPPQAYGAFELYYTDSLLPEYSASSIAWIGSISTAMLVCAGVLAGPFFDRGYLKPILALGCLLMVLGLMMLSLSTEYYQVMLSQGICFGIGSGLVYVPGLAFVTGSFTKLRAYAVAVTTTGASVGGMIFPIMFIKLVPEVGFPWTCRIFGFIDLALSMAGLALLSSAPVKKSQPRKLFQLGAFLEPAYFTLALGFFLQFLGYWIPLFFIPSFASSALGASRDLSIYAVAIFNAASVFGRLLPAFLITKFGAVNVVCSATVAIMILLFCWIAVSNLAGFLVWCVFLGFSSGVLISGNPVIAAHPQISALAVLGTRLGQLWLCAGIAALVGTPIAGALTDPATGAFLDAQIFAGSILAGASLVFLYPVVSLNAYDKKAKNQSK